MVQSVGYFLWMHIRQPLIVTGHESGDVQIWNYETQQKVVASIKVSKILVMKTEYVSFSTIP